jgi:signal transduction histidine kinase
MTTEIAKLQIVNEMDIVLAHRRAMQIAKFAGINIAEQTRFATAVSEICRNALEYCKEGNIVYDITMISKGRYMIVATVSDCGSGIKGLKAILARDLQNYQGKGRGIVFSKKLVDTFKITSGPKGTTVLMGINIPDNTNPINNLIIQGWIKHIKKEQPLSAYEEVKLRNSNLILLTEELRNEKQKTEEHLREITLLNERLQKTNNNLEEFTFALSHDLKTPLTSLKLSLELLEDAADPITKNTYIEMIRRAGQRLDKTVTGLVEILDVYTRNHNVTKTVNLEEFFKEIKEEFSILASGKEVFFTGNFMVREVNYIETYLNSIFTNLISNSIKYRVPGRPLEISISSNRKDDKVLLTFSDNAEGIDLENYGHRLFTPFTRFNNEQEGRGIGLYIIKKMVERNGGSIKIESKLNCGTTFTLELLEYAFVGK